jgi:hypothetical protein
MKARAFVATAAVVMAVAAAASIAIAVSAPKVSASPEAQAKATAVAKQFMRTLQDGHFAQTCRLLSDRFYRENHVPSRARCELALRATFTGAAVRFEVLDVQIDRARNRAVVEALANGSPGKIVLVQENHLFKVLSVDGA